MNRPPKPKPFPCRHCGDDSQVGWHWGQEYWYRKSECAQCKNMLDRHGLTGPEYRDLMATGCSVSGCDRPATEIDHDHRICPNPRHSCDKCRRGPLCKYHNGNIIQKIDALRAGKFDAELAYLKLSVQFSEAA